jgi:multicomponent Na+:H+ antiporter subunit G
VVTIAEGAAIAFVAGGVFFAFVAAVGLLRLPDVYARTHAASKSDTLGAVLSLAGVAIAFGADIALAKTIFLLVFMFVTNPTAAHAIARAAHDQGIEPWTTESRETGTKQAPNVEESDTGTTEPATDGGIDPGVEEAPANEPSGYERDERS